MKLETPISFANDIAVLFTDPDVGCMNSRIQLRDYAVMSDPAGNEDFANHATARNVLPVVAAWGAFADASGASALAASRHRSVRSVYRAGLSALGFAGRFFRRNVNCR